MATAITAAQAELISSLTQDEIPIKLRCAICRRLAVNAFRLPCCEQAICETCQSTLPESCPVCEHSPVSAEDCKPNKALRTTIKVFLRTEEKKREAIRLKEAKHTPPETPAPIPTPVDPVPFTPPKSEISEPKADEQAVVEEPTPAVESESVSENPVVGESIEAEQDIPQQSIEDIAPGQEPREDGDANQAGDAAEDGDGQIAETDGNEQPLEGQIPAFGAGFGFNPSAAGGFPGMDTMQMQQMQLMQQMMIQGIVPNTFGNFPMMGMGMDPMAMQNMMSGGFSAGMGMNGMNMGMGNMGGFEGSGAGFNNGWNGQQSWNAGQDNYNHPNAAGMGHGDYGSNNSGYPHSAGYNQSNYGRGNQYNNYQNSYGYRGRGRGRGGYANGRGGYGYGSQDEFSQQYPQQQFSSGQQANDAISEITATEPAGPKVDAASGDVDEFGREIRHTSEAKEAVQGEGTETSKDDTTAAIKSGTTENGDNVESSEDAKDAQDFDDSTPKPIQTLDEAESAFQQNYNYDGYNQGFNPRGRGFGAMQPPLVKPIDVPINAPTGPKAMREGLPNTGLSGLKARGLPIAGIVSSTPGVNGSASASVPLRTFSLENKDRDKTRSPSRDRSRSRDRRRSRSRERHRRHRHRSMSLSEDEKETERRRQRRKERRDKPDERRRHRDDGKDDRGDDKDESKEERVDEQRSRSASPSDSRRSSHRSRRDKDGKYRERDRDDMDKDRDRDKYRDRDDDVDHKSSYKHRSSRRRHDDRSRSRDRSRDRDREHRYRHSRRGSQTAIDDKASKTDASVPPTPVEAESPKAPSRRLSLITNGANGIEIKGASTRKKIIIADLSIPTGPRSAREKEKEKESARGKEKPSRHEEDRYRSDRSKGEREKEAPSSKEKERACAAPSAAPPVQDPHTLEREARNRERLLKEAQRIAGLASQGGGRKRSRDDVDDASGRKGRKKRGHESEDSRLARLEAERESARWQ